jgi:hypothetical protein
MVDVEAPDPRTVKARRSTERHPQEHQTEGEHRPN